MLCPNCGAELLENAKFCMKCGTAAPAASGPENPAAAAQGAQPAPAPQTVQQPVMQQAATPQQGMPQPQAAQQVPLQGAAPAQKKSKIGLIIALAVVAAVIVVGVAGFAVVNMLAGPTVSPVFVEDGSTSESSNGYSSKTTMTYDNAGNLVAISGSKNEVDGAMIDRDSKGYMTSVTVKSKKYATITNTLDTNGRVTESRFEFAAGPVFTSKYEYHGNSLNLKSITNTSDSKLKTTQAIALNELGVLRDSALDTFVDATGTITTEYDESGRPIAITDFNGRQELKVTPKAERAGQTKVSGNTETTYDENGNVIRTAVSSNDTEHSSYSYTHTYHKVDDPSFAAYIFNHIY